ncbi:hypothetical protein B0H14DRAFT_3449434 [Mycena olivaceomarginata]|nr:hypothetical protein B0H14DRAFT_3449434 [Mycena olivaceomarginata]
MVSQPPEDFETIHPLPVPPSWSTPFTFDIASDKDEALKRSPQSDLCLYSDGSGLDGNIGAACITDHRSDTFSRRLHLDSDLDHAVFKSEVAGTILAPILHPLAPPCPCIFLGVDNQAAILALRCPRQQPGQYHLLEFHAELERLRTVHNASMERRNRSLNTIYLLTPAFPHYFTSPAPRMERRFSHLDRSATVNSIHKPLINLSHRNSSLIVQLLTRMAGLNAWLHSIHRAESPLCQTCQRREDISHFIFSAPGSHTIASIYVQPSAARPHPSATSSQTKKESSTYYQPTTLHLRHQSPIYIPSTTNISPPLYHLLYYIISSDSNPPPSDLAICLRVHASEPCSAPASELYSAHDVPSP